MNARQTLIVVLVAALAACGGQQSSSSSSTSAGSQILPSNEVLESIEIVPPGDVTVDNALGAGFQIAVDGNWLKRDASTETRDETRNVTYVSDDETVCLVSGDGLITPVSLGTTTVRAQIHNGWRENLEAVKTVSVVRPGTRAPVFIAVEVLPTHRTLRNVDPVTGQDQLQQMLVLGTDASGRVHDLTRSAGMRVQDDNGLPANFARITPMGLLRGVAPGKAIVTGRIDSAQLIAGSQIVCGAGSANPITPGTTLYAGFPLAGSANPIDIAVLDGLQQRGIEPASLADDGEFLRRLYADAVGRTPTETELTAFTNSPASTRRSAEVDRLLNRTEFNTYWAGVLGEWLQMPRKVVLEGSARANYDFSSAKSMTVTVSGVQQVVTLTPAMFNEPDKARVAEVIREINKFLSDARAFRFDQYVHLETTSTGSGVSLTVDGGAAAMTLGLENKAGTVFDTWAENALAQGTDLGAMFSRISRGQVPSFEAQHPTAADKVDVLILAGTSHTARCARCHDHPLPGPNDKLLWVQDERYPLDAFFARTPDEATKLDGKLNIRFDLPMEPGFVLDPTATVSTTLASPLADRRDEFARLFTASDAFMTGLGHRIFSQVATPLVDPNQFLQVNLDGIMVPKVFLALGSALRAEGTSLEGFLKTVFNSKYYQLSSDATNVDPANDDFLVRRTLRIHNAEVFENGLNTLTSRTVSGGDLAFLHQTFGFPFARKTITERLNAVNMGQSLLLLNSPVLQNRITAGGAKIDSLASQVTAGTSTRTEAVQRIFLAALSRRADATELAMYLDLITQAPSVREGLEDAAAATAALVEFGLH